VVLKPVRTIPAWAGHPYTDRKDYSLSKAFDRKYMKRTNDRIATPMVGAIERFLASIGRFFALVA
jgi:hypothetical protein